MGQTLPNIALTVAQLLQFNCFFRRRETNSNCGRHSKDRETPVPLYVGLTVHAQTRKRELVDTVFKLGISISYDRVLGISAEIGNSVCRRFEEDGVLCPIKLRRGQFTTSAIDNIDHNPSSNTAQGSFHGTNISLFQNISEGNPGCEREAIVMANDTGSVTKSICSLPEWYAEVPPALLRGERAQPPDMGRPEGADGCFLSRGITDEYEWVDQVKISVNQE